MLRAFEAGNETAWHRIWCEPSRRRPASKLTAPALYAEHDTTNDQAAAWGEFGYDGALAAIG